MSDKIDGEKPRPEPPSGVVPPRVNLEELAQQMVQNLNDPTGAERVDTHEKELEEEMRNAISRVLQKKDAAKKGSL